MVTQVMGLTIPHVLRIDNPLTGPDLQLGVIFMASKYVIRRTDMCICPIVAVGL